MFYNLSSNQSARMNYDEMIRRFADAVISAVEDDSTVMEKALEDWPEYIEDVWQMELEDTENSVDDLEEAKARFTSGFESAVSEKLKEYWTNKLYKEERGYVGAVGLFKAGQINGNHYNETVIDVGLLNPDSGELVYRYSDDSHDDDWQIGDVSDLVDEAVLKYDLALAAEQDAAAGW